MVRTSNEGLGGRSRTKLLGHGTQQQGKSGQEICLFLLLEEKYYVHFLNISEKNNQGMYLADICVFLINCKQYQEVQTWLICLLRGGGTKSLGTNHCLYYLTQKTCRPNDSSRF